MLHELVNHWHRIADQSRIINCFVFGGDDSYFQKKMQMAGPQKMTYPVLGLDVVSVPNPGDLKPSISFEVLLARSVSKDDFSQVDATLEVLLEHLLAICRLSKENQVWPLPGSWNFSEAQPVVKAYSDSLHGWLVSGTYTFPEECAEFSHHFEYPGPDPAVRAAFTWQRAGDQITFTDTSQGHIPASNTWKWKRDGKAEEQETGEGPVVVDVPPRALSMELVVEGAGGEAVARCLILPNERRTGGASVEHIASKEVNPGTPS